MMAVIVVPVFDESAAIERVVVGAGVPHPRVLSEKKSP